MPVRAAHGIGLLLVSAAASPAASGPRRVDLRLRPVGRHALCQGERRAEDAGADRRHERVGHRVLDLRRRHQGRQLEVHATTSTPTAIEDVQRVQASPWSTCPATTSGPIATAPTTAATTTSSASITCARSCSRTPKLRREQDAARAPGQAGREVRREHPLRPWRHRLRRPQHPGQQQQQGQRRQGLHQQERAHGRAMRRRQRRVCRARRRQHRVDARGVRAGEDAEGAPAS